MRRLVIELQPPEDLRKLRLPRALNDRLQELLDRQDGEGKLTPRERRETKALTELVDLLSLIRLRAKPTPSRRRA